MWGHPTSCTCPLCHSLNRVFLLLREGEPLPVFGPLACGHVRVLEAELRDALAFSVSHGRAVPPRAPPEGQPPPSEELQPGALPARPPGATPPPEGPASAHPAPPDPEREPSGSCLYPKSKPAEPARASEEIRLKVERTSSPEGLVEAEAVDKEPSSAAKPHRERGESKDKEKAKKKKKDKRRTRSRSRRREKPRGEHRSPRSRSGKRRSRGDRRSYESARSVRGRERKVRPAEPRSPLRPRSPPFPPRPRSPSRPPPGYRTPQGRGWIGPIPYSNHPRWSEGTNKGLTKRAKQEYHNRWR